MNKICFRQKNETQT